MEILEIKKDGRKAYAHYNMVLDACKAVGVPFYKNLDRRENGSCAVFVDSDKFDAVANKAKELAKGTLYQLCEENVIEDLDKLIEEL